MNVKKWKITAPITRWDEAVPVGNGLIGGLLWGDGRKMKLSLDRCDLWDERTNGVYEHPDWSYRALQEIVATGDEARLALQDELYERITATKLPVGRIEIDFSVPEALQTFELDMEHAIAWGADATGARRIECFAAADQSGIYLKLAAPQAATLRIVPPDYDSTKTLDDQQFVKSPAGLGYPAGQLKTTGRLMYYVQQCGDGGLHYVILVRKIAGDVWFISVERVDSASEPAALITRFNDDGFTAADWESALSLHTQWWRNFWNHSGISLDDDPEMERFYHLNRYLFGSVSRQNTPPASLQGLWTADEGTLPPWRGDYHHDLNTQLTYCGYLTCGDFSCGESFFNHLSSQLEIHREFTRRYYDSPGIGLAGTCTLGGQALGGWPQYSMSPTNSAWLAIMFVQHVRYAGDEEFLRHKAWPFAHGVGEFIEHLLYEDDNGRYRLPLSTSPEIHDNRLEAFLGGFSNYDLALIRKLFLELIYLAEQLDDQAEKNRWQAHLAKLPDFAVDPEKGLMLCPNENLMESHRHHSHLLAIWPLRLLNMTDDGEVITASLRHLDRLGSGYWVGFSYPWAAAMAAYCGRGERALKFLQHFCDGFLSRNGFHLNGDFKDLGYSWVKYRPFTLETNFLAQQVIQEMLLQTHAGTIRIFPAVPNSWRTVSFVNWRGEGGVKISASLADHRITAVRIAATKPVSLQIVNPCRNIELLSCSHPHCDPSQNIWSVHLKEGEEFMCV
ncbi:glycoside hydrolase N-terminal domain-containing protein [Victivallis sp. Marseille-Q1083]|uniref:glycosyl hydrolase family 95 catalytic domain-containing protein n=1 Tax=Victivallis sp. Marseille-Q1083 TaxID=2717288 RepID=UPI00158EFB70|nr:glycoside hydrolase N-terminal domain-containing protein [Victivallis sp. Marseille-Q1083]